MTSDPEILLSMDADDAAGVEEILVDSGVRPDIISRRDPGIVEESDRQ